jgi:hypothetical protein
MLGVQVLQRRPFPGGVKGGGVMKRFPEGGSGYSRGFGYEVTLPLPKTRWEVPTADVIRWLEQAAEALRDAKERGFASITLIDAGDNWETKTSTLTFTSRRRTA